MPPQKNTIASDFNQKCADFLKIDLETGLTFANIALGEEPGSAERIKTQANARRAYETVLRLRNRIQIPTEAVSREIQNGLDQLRSALEKLGEKVS